MRNSSWWKYFSSYFPVHLLKTVDLDPSRSYIFGYHPHGIISVGALVNFGTEATGWSREFPGIDIHLLTLAIQFYFPFWREILISMGLADVSATSCKNLLSKGSSIAIVIGGAEESLYSKPGTADLKLLHRKGFVALGLKTGSSLVPTFSFGENDLWVQVDNPEGSKLRYFQETMKRLITFTIPVFHGRGVFQYDYGFLPFRKPIHTVIGTPIDLPKIEKPSQDEVDKYHSLYLQNLQTLYDTYKNTHYQDRVSDLKFV